MIELQFETSTPGKPASANVGTSGRNGDRLGVVTASGLSCPERISGSDVSRETVETHYPSLTYFLTQAH